MKVKEAVGAAVAAGEGEADGRPGVGVTGGAGDAVGRLSVGVAAGEGNAVGRLCVGVLWDGAGGGFFGSWVQATTDVASTTVIKLFRAVAQRGVVAFLTLITSPQQR